MYLVLVPSRGSQNHESAYFPRKGAFLGLRAPVQCRAFGVCVYLVGARSVKFFGKTRGFLKRVHGCNELGMYRREGSGFRNDEGRNQNDESMTKAE